MNHLWKKKYDLILEFKQTILCIIRFSIYNGMYISFLGKLRTMTLLKRLYNSK